MNKNQIISQTPIVAPADVVVVPVVAIPDKKTPHYTNAEVEQLCMWFHANN
jgi:hypothetical protein